MLRSLPEHIETANETRHVHFHCIQRMSAITLVLIVKVMCSFKMNCFNTSFTILLVNRNQKSTIVWIGTPCISVELIQGYRISYYRRLYFSYSLLWEPKIEQKLELYFCSWFIWRCYCFCSDMKVFRIFHNNFGLFYCKRREYICGDICCSIRYCHWSL